MVRYQAVRDQALASANGPPGRSAGSRSASIAGYPRVARRQRAPGATDATHSPAAGQTPGAATESAPVGSPSRGALDMGWSSRLIGGHVREVGGRAVVAQRGRVL